jgi:phage protein D
MTDQFGSVAPVFKVAGEVKGELGRDVSRLEVEEATDGLKTMFLRLVAIGPQPNAAEEQLLYLDGKILDFGKEIEVSIGPSDNERIIFTGLVSGIEASFSLGADPYVAVYAEDKLMKLRTTRRMKTYENQSDADIARSIANDNALSADVAVDGPSYPIVQQWNQSDLAFLRERARLLQAEIWFAENTLHFKSRGNRNATELTLVAGNDLIDVQARADLAHQRSQIKVSGYDAQSREAIDESAGSEAIQAEISNGRSGISVLERAFGERTSYRVRETPLTSSDAAAWARAEMLRRARSFVTVTGTTNGSPDMVVGSRLTLDRVGGPFSGSGYYVTTVRHSYDLTDGFRTSFEAERATLSESA